MPINTLRTIPEVNTSSVECISDSSSEREYMTDGSEDTDYSDGSNSTKLSETSDTMNGEYFALAWNHRNHFQRLRWISTVRLEGQRYLYVSTSSGVSGLSPVFIL